MANGYSSGTIFGPDLSLTPDQQSLLRTALSSNNPDTPISNGHSASPNSSGAFIGNGNTNSNEQQASPHTGSFIHSPTTGANNSLVDSFPLDDSPLVDGNDFEDGNFDYDNSEDQFFGDLPGGPSNDEEDIHDKRKNSPNDEKEDGKNKRHEGNDKNSKKPGRKPLNNSEPTTVSLQSRFSSIGYPD